MAGQPSADVGHEPDWSKKDIEKDRGSRTHPQVVEVSIEQIVRLKSILAAILPVLVAVSCHSYLKWSAKQSDSVRNKTVG